MYSKWNPVHIIKGKKVIDNQELVENYTNDDEKLKRFIFTLAMYLMPGLYALIYLVIFEDIKYRTLFYIPFVGLYFVMKYYRAKYEAILISKCRNRQDRKEVIL